jgi:hypothetical protein
LALNRRTGGKYVIPITLALIFVLLYLNSRSLAKVLIAVWRSLYSINVVWASVRQHTDDGAAGAYYLWLDICIRGR